MPNYNANTLILLPKIPNVDSIEVIRPIALVNLKFKIISRLLQISSLPLCLQSHPRRKMDFFFCFIGC